MGLFDVIKPKGQSFEEKFLLYLNDIYRTALRLTGSRDEADDLTQETFFKAYKAFTEGASVSAPKAWLFKIMRNSFINRRTSLAARTEHVPFEDLPEQASHETPEDVMIRKTLEGRLHTALLDMPAEYRLALLLCDSEGLSYDEIAGIMQCPVGTVRSRINRARTLVRAALRENADKVDTKR